jgi:DNA adenine methylase
MANKNSKGFVVPFLKWAGGKSQILTEIRRVYPVGLGKTLKKYAEPFVGGGAVLFDVLSHYDLQDVYISDINRELIHTYTCVRDRVDELIELLHGLEESYLPADTETRKIMYYDVRSSFNAHKLSGSIETELAAQLIFLNHTCFNGLYRVNSRGEFNVPQGSYKNPTICNEANLRAVSAALQEVRIVCGDYKQSRDFIDKHTFVYFDPPYRPLNATSSFTAYAADGFGDEQQAKLAQFIDEIVAKGALFAASNSDPKNTDASDNFFDALYRHHIITRISAARAINSVGNGRRRVSELLIAKV